MTTMLDDLTRRQEDQRNRAILLDRVRALDALSGPRVGDWVRFACGSVQRVGIFWTPERPQCVDGAGSFYLGDGYASCSGVFHRTFSLDSLTPTDEQRAGDVWIFHHDHAGAGRAVPYSIGFHVYESTEVAPS